MAFRPVGDLRLALRREDRAPLRDGVDGLLSVERDARRRPHGRLLRRPAHARHAGGALAGRAADAPLFARAHAVPRLRPAARAAVAGGRAPRHGRPSRRSSACSRRCSPTSIFASCSRCAPDAALRERARAGARALARAPRRACSSSRTSSRRWRRRGGAPAGARRSRSGSPSIAWSRRRATRRGCATCAASKRPLRLVVAP